MTYVYIYIMMFLDKSCRSHRGSRQVRKTNETGLSFAASQLRSFAVSVTVAVLSLSYQVLPSPTKSYQVLPHSGPGSGGSPTRHGTVMAMDKRWQKLVHCHEDFQGKSVLPSPTVNHGEPSLPSHIHVLNDICGWLRQSPAAVLDEKFWRTTWQHPES